MDALAERGPEVEQRAALAVALLAVDPVGLGGAVVRSVRHDAVARWLDQLRAALPAGAPFNRMATGIPDDRLFGGLDLALTLATGRPVAERGLLARTDGGVLVLPGAERAGPSLVGRLCATLDTATIAPRGPLLEESPARIAIVALDEGEADDEPVSAALVDRLAFILTVTPSDPESFVSRDDVAAARERFARVRLRDAQVASLVAVSATFGIESLRAIGFAVRAARANAALDGRDVVEDVDLTVAATLVLGPRATRRPAPANEPEQEPEQPTAPPPPDESDPQAESLEDSKGLEDLLVNAIATALPLSLTSESGGARRQAAAKDGRAGGDRSGGKRGRQVGTRRGDPRSGGRLDLLETLRAAAPWQRLRTPPPDVPRDTSDDTARDTGRTKTRTVPRIQVRLDDFRLRHLVEPAGTTAIFVVDASGSAAVARLGEAKGAVELLLADAYSRRDEVGVIAFRGTAAEVLLPPTRAVAAAKRALAALPGGGGTPLASAIDKARELVTLARRAGNDTVAVFLTDARANIARDGTPGRPQAEADALASAQALSALGGTVLFIDTSARPSPQAQAMAAALGARYVALPRTDARGIHAAVTAAMPVRTA